MSPWQHLDILQKCSFFTVYKNLSNVINVFSGQNKKSEDVLSSMANIHFLWNDILPINPNLLLSLEQCGPKKTAITLAALGFYKIAGLGPGDDVHWRRFLRSFLYRQDPDHEPSLISRVQPRISARSGINGNNIVAEIVQQLRDKDGCHIWALKILDGLINSRSGLANLVPVMDWLAWEKIKLDLVIVQLNVNQVEDGVLFPRKLALARQLRQCSINAFKRVKGIMIHQGLGYWIFQICVEFILKVPLSLMDHDFCDAMDLSNLSENVVLQCLDKPGQQVDREEVEDVEKDIRFARCLGYEKRNLPLDL